MINQDLFDQAVEAAWSRFPDDAWDRLPPGEKIAAIHEELRRIDPDSVVGMIPLNSGPSGWA